MAQGDFTKEEVDQTVEAVQEMFDALPEKKKADYLGHINDIFLFLDAAKNAAPCEEG